ncbi:MAG: hypothetical protein IJM82_07870 [Synergistaceae bacterium]|nr:hypothetical protein [Synergistaceae bacterium]MBQ7069065.1 hypothetical protein [Synergistaceae bacterium]MBR0234745.1 hypothetical protein [Synergistaceae bacterium]MBR0253404.1 hypothetical protein [Synergistaceae bacterium]
MKKVFSAMLLILLFSSSSFGQTENINAKLDIIIEELKFQKQEIQSLRQALNDLTKTVNELTAKVNELTKTVNDLAKTVAVLSERVDRNFETLSQRIDDNFAVLSKRIDDNYKILSQKISENYEMLSQKISDTYRNSDARISDLRNGMYLVLVLLGLVVTFPAAKRFLQWNDERRQSRTPPLTQEDVKRLIAEALENFSVKTQV